MGQKWIFFVRTSGGNEREDFIRVSNATLIYLFHLVLELTESIFSPSVSLEHFIYTFVQYL